MTDNMWIIDAFTSRPFKGNAAAVCIVDAFPSDEDMQLIALSMQLSETAFLVKTSPHRYNLRWFTPEVEVKLCGHATLAAAHALLQSGEIKMGDVVVFDTLSGELKARAHEKGIELDFPTLAGVPAKPHKALDALGVEILACEKNRDKYLVEVKDFNTLITIAPNFKKLAKMDALGVVVTTANNITDFDFASRYFAPAIGINEDPVTGSAHCFLSAYWGKKLGKNTFHAYQASKGEGVLDVTLAGERTLISGTCVTTLKGRMPRLPKKNTKESAA